MRKFVTELQGMTVTTSQGQVLGKLDNLVVDTLTGAIAHLLVTVNEGVETKPFRKDAKGRIILPFASMRAVKDVVIVDLKS